MGIRAVERIDGAFELKPECEETLKGLMLQENFLTEVQAQKSWDCEVEFTGILFQPIPWTPAEHKGMPKDCEKYLASDNHVIVNVPPTFMFKALIFKPPRLAAIFRKMGAADPVDEPEKST